MWNVSSNCLDFFAVAPFHAFFDSSLANHKLSYISKYIGITYALDLVHEKIDEWTEAGLFAVLSDHPSQIEQYSRPEYKSADPNWFICRISHVLNSNIRFTTWKVWCLNRALQNFTTSEIFNN